MIQVSMTLDDFGRLVCLLSDGPHEATVTASNMPQAGEELVAALEDARDTGYGECLWEEQGGQYRWMFRREADRLTLVVLWSTVTLTGWQHVFRSECDLTALLPAVTAQLASAVASNR
jgi:hypothetical protein